MSLIDQVKISSRLEDISLVESKVEQIKCRLDIQESIYGNMMLAVVEAVTNAIEHGNRCAPDKAVTFETYQNTRHVTFVVKDEGDGFNPDIIPDPTLPENIENPNGRGVFLIKNLADEVVFKDDGRTIELNFKL